MATWIEEGTTTNFDALVLQGSQELPVLVDFWAPWCGPCRTLAPLLEAAVAARAGGVRLVEVDTDQHPGLAQRYGIRGIPAVKAFVDGAVASEFVGLQDRGAIDRFIDGLMPSEAQRALVKAESALAAGRWEELETLLTPWLTDPEHRDAAHVLLARAAAAQQRFAVARALLAEVTPEGPNGPAAAALATRVELSEAAAGHTRAATQAACEQQPDDPALRWRLAACHLAAGDAAAALEQLLELLQRTRSFASDGARRAMVAIFDELGPEHELVREYRRRMQVYL